MPDLLAGDLALCAVVPKGDAKSYQKLLAEAGAAARLCVCEAQTGVAADIKKCRDCGHTACAKCCGRPEHNYADHVLTRGEPNDFAAKLKKTLPMRVKLEGLDVAAASAKAKALAKDAPALFGSQSSEDDSRDETWRQWHKAMETVANAEFLFRDVSLASRVGARELQLAPFTLQRADLARAPLELFLAVVCSSLGIRQPRGRL